MEPQNPRNLPVLGNWKAVRYGQTSLTERGDLQIILDSTDYKNYSRKISLFRFIKNMRLQAIARKQCPQLQEFWQPGLNLPESEIFDSIRSGHEVMAVELKTLFGRKAFIPCDECGSTINPSDLVDGTDGAKDAIISRLAKTNSIVNVTNIGTPVLMYPVAAAPVRRDVKVTFVLV